MSLIVLAVFVTVVLLVLLNRRRWQALGRGTRAFPRRLQESYERPGRLPAREASSPEKGQGQLAGYTVLATDGPAGQAQRLTANATALTIEIDPLVTGRVVSLPTTAITHIDHRNARIEIDRSKHELAEAPLLEPDTQHPA